MFCRRLQFLSAFSYQTPCHSVRLYSHAPIRPFKILFMGRDEFSCIVLRELYAAKGEHLIPLKVHPPSSNFTSATPDVWQSIDIATNPDEKIIRRGAQLSVSPLKLLGESLKIPVYTIPHTKAEFRHWKPPQPFATIDTPPLNHVVVTASFGRILSSSLLESFASGKRLNVHPSLLPAYRGSAPIQHTLINGEKETGVCIIDMLKFKDGIDAGAIWGCSRAPLYNGAMFPEVRDMLAHIGGRLLVSVLRNMRIGTAHSTSQDPLGTFRPAPAITADDALIDFKTMSAEMIINRHRGISHQRAITVLLPSGKGLQLHSPEEVVSSSAVISMPGVATLEKSTETLVVSCANNSAIRVPLLKQDGKALMPAKDWWNGAKGLGLVVGNELRL